MELAQNGRKVELNIEAAQNDENAPVDENHKKWYRMSRLRASCILLAIAVIVALLISTAVTFSRRHKDTSRPASKGVVYSPIHPPSYPLAVKNPYFSAWIPGKDVASLPSSKARFWSGEELTWSLMARVNDRTYNLFGIKNTQVNASDAKVLSATYTSSHSTFVLSAGPVEFSLDFLSPVNAKDYIRQSLPFSYLTVSVLNLAKNSSIIQIYSDIDDTWNGQNPESYQQTTSWNSTTSETSSIWQLNHVGAEQYSQGGPNGQMALWGSTVYATKPAINGKLTMGAGPPSAVRSSFMQNGNLSELGATHNWTAGSVTAFVHDLGLVNVRRNVTFALGYYRDCDVRYFNTCRQAYYKSEYPDPVSAAEFFLGDYSKAQAHSLALDATIEKSAISAVGQHYADIVALSTRQTMGAIDLTIPANLSTTDTMVFMKEISSDGNVNTVDVIFPSIPQFYVLDVEYIRYLLEPIMQYLATGRWTRPFAIHDIGNNYPIANGHDQLKEEDMPIEESGNLLILAYMYTKASGNSSWAEQYRSIFQGYADYLVDNGLYPAFQLGTVDAAGPAANQTNLAIKAAVALNAFGVMTGQSNYSDIGIGFAKTIYDEGLGTNAAKTHFLNQYGEEKSWTTTFNLLPDKWLKLNTFNTSAYDMQSAWYPTVRSKAGVPLASNLQFTSTQWDLWAGATSSNSTMHSFVTDIWTYVSNGLNTGPLSDRFGIGANGAGRASANRARPVVGGHWCAMALQGRF